MGNILVRKNRLEEVAAARQKERAGRAAETEQELPLSAKNMFSASNQIIISMGIGTIIFILLKMVGITFPILCRRNVNGGSASKYQYLYGKV